MTQRLEITFGDKELNRWLAARRSTDRANGDEPLDRHKEDNEVKDQYGYAPPQRYPR